ncbi:MAG TPA: 50S ribosomal protein L21 [Solirubrobacteraceae bacterium]|jgi:large subunit ribosomal protein L21
MYAIVKTGGKQYRVEEGQTLLIERLPEPEGASVNLEPLLYRSDEAVFDADALAKVEVKATIVGHVRGKKLRVFKFKPKRGYKRRTGHRQELTRIEVTKIGARGSSRAAAKPAVAGEAGNAPAPRSPRARAASAETTAAPKPRAPRKPAAEAEAAQSAPETVKEEADGA